MGRTNATSERWIALKTAKGAAKHKLLKATILSRPRAWAIFVLAAHSAIKETRMPAAPIETGMGEKAKNSARTIVCM